MKKYIAVMCILVLCLAGSVSSIKAQEAKKYCFGVHGAYSAGGDIEDSKVGFGAQAEVSINENLSVELALSHFSDEYEEMGISLDQDLTTIGISAIYRTPITEGVKGYLLGGLNYNIADADASIDPALFGTNINADIDVDNEIGFHIGAGLNFPLMDKLSLFTEYRYTFLELKGDVSVSDIGVPVTESIKGDYDFGLLKIGVNYLF